MEREEVREKRKKRLMLKQLLNGVALKHLQRFVLVIEGVCHLVQTKRLTLTEWH